MDKILELTTWILPLIIAIVFHEVAHGWTARYFGDPTAAQEGRLSLNPFKHVDPLGTVILPAMLAIAKLPVFGWAKPVPVDPSRLRNPRWHMVIVAAAGPLSNILMAIIACVLLFIVMPADVGSSNEVDGVSTFLMQNLTNFMLINLFLAVFNMLPIPPFDGSRVLAGILPPELGAKVHALDRYALLIMIFFLVIIPQVAPQFDVVSGLVSAPVGYLFNMITGAVGSVFGQG